MRRLLLVAVSFALVLSGTLFWLASRPADLSGTPQASGPVSTVVLIPGYGGSTQPLAALASSLKAAGRTVLVLNIDDGQGDLRLYADRLLSLTAEGPVDVVGYSAGGLVARAAVQSSPGSFHRVVTVGSPHNGTVLASLGAMFAPDACPTACAQMASSSEFLSSLPSPADPLRVLSIYSSSDDVIRPADSSVLDGAANVEVGQQCAAPGLDHSSLPAAPVTSALVESFLATGSPVC